MKNKIKKPTRLVRGISFEPDVLICAKQRAKERRQSLSAYINFLILPYVANISQQGDSNHKKGPQND